MAGAKRRAVLALLSLEFGHSVSVERFFEMLWSDEPPTQAKAALQGHVAALRKVLAGTSFRLVTRAPGYLLTGDADQVDLLRFEALTARALATGDDAESAVLLQEALDQWTGTALADLPETELRRAFVERLDESRNQAVSAWAERQLRLGAGAVAVPVLEQQVRADSLREQPIALLIRCLHQAGRSAEALTTYHHTRIRLDDELGVTPGPALRDALAAVLAYEQDPVPPRPQAAPTAPPGPAPADTGLALPRQSRGFVGRTVESRWLDHECGPDRAGFGLAAVVGPAGVGKSSTVIRWAHSVASGFPDGLLFIDLQGFAPDGPRDPAEVFGQLLRGLGVPEDAIPEDRAARTALYRDRTEGRRLLLILDNAGSADGIADLLPAGSSCATVVTSRNTLEGLVVTEGAAMLRLEALSCEDALSLLMRFLTPDRVRAEPEAAKRLIALCDRLPLALRIASAKLASRPGWTLAHLVEELEDEETRLPALDTYGLVSMRTALRLTYSRLPPKAGQLLGLLSAHPAAEVDAFSVAALLGTDVAAARHALDSLVAYHLVTESAPNRYSRHSLIRLFGVELLAGHGPEVRRAALVRLLDHYLEWTRRVGIHLLPRAGPFACAADPPRAMPQITGVRSALNWFRTEEYTIRALVTAAAADGEHERALRLARIYNEDTVRHLKSAVAFHRRRGDLTLAAQLTKQSARIRRSPVG